MPDNPPVKKKQDPGKPPTRGEFKILQTFVYAGFFVTVLAVITLIVQYFTSTQETFQNLTNQITSQSTKIDLLYQQCSNDFYKQKLQR